MEKIIDSLEIYCVNDYTQKELEWLLCHNINDWLVKTRELVRNATLRKHLGELSYKVTKEIYSMEVTSPQWWDIYLSVL